MSEEREEIQQDQIPSAIATSSCSDELPVTVSEESSRHQSYGRFLGLTLRVLPAENSSTRERRNSQPIREHRMTVASVWYDKNRHAAMEHEMHFKAARRGNIETIRRQLAERGIEYFQQYVYRKERRWIPKHKIKAKFERERPATRTEPLIMIDVRAMEYRGREWKAQPFPPRILPYVKKRRKPRLLKARRPRIRRKRHAKSRSRR